MESTAKKSTWFVRVFTNDNFILSAICLFTILVILREFNITHWTVICLNELCTLIFLMEMIAKHIKLGVNGYWSNILNFFDGVLVIMSLTMIACHLSGVEVTDVSVLMVLRVLRVFRIFRILKAFKDLKVIGRNFVSAMKKCSGLFVSFSIIILAIAILCCSLFKDDAPEYFRDPLASVYTVFRLFTVEGWYEIPDAISQNLTGLAPTAVRLFFSVVLILGGVIGMSLVNSVFVDEMVADNNDDMKEDIKDLQAQISELSQKLDKIIEAQNHQLSQHSESGLPENGGPDQSLQ